MHLKKYNTEPKQVDSQKKKLEDLDRFIAQNLVQKENIQEDIAYLLKESERIGYQKGIAMAYYHQANYERKVLQNHTKALESYEKSEAIFNRIPNLEKEKILLTIVKGISLEALGKYDLALVSYHKGLDFYDEDKEFTDSNIKEYQSYLYWNIANVHEKLERYDSAEEFYLKALEDFKKEKNQNEIANISNNLGFMYLKQEEFDKAQDMFESSLKIYKALQDSLGISDVYTNLGALSFEEKNFMESLKYFKNALKIREKLKDIRKISQAYYNIGDSYKEMDSLNQAQLAIEKAIQMAESIESIEDLQTMYQEISEIYEESFDYEKALNAYKKYRQLSDSLFNMDRQKVIEETIARYSLDQKEKEIHEMKMRTYIFAGASMGILLALGAALIQTQKKRKAFKTIEEKNKALEKSENELKEAQEILKEINKNLESIIDEKTREIQDKNTQLEDALQELKMTLENLKIAHKELASIDKSKSEFLGLLSHNFATPISNIVQALGLLEMFIPDNDKDEAWYKKFKDMIVNPLNTATKKLKDRVYLMQTALSLQNKTRPIDKELNSIDGVNTHISYIINQYADRCDISHEGVDSENLLEIDESLFMEIMKILLNNAEDFSQQIYNTDEKKASCYCGLNENPNAFSSCAESDEKPIIHIKTHQDDTYFYVDVRDHGRGFSPQALKNFGKLMTPGDDIQNLHEGLGLGIFTAKMIMNEHDGEIRAKNNSDGGATVTLKFKKSDLSLDDL